MSERRAPDALRRCRAETPAAPDLAARVRTRASARQVVPSIPTSKMSFIRRCSRRWDSREHSVAAPQLIVVEHGFREALGLHAVKGPRRDQRVGAGERAHRPVMPPSEPGWKFGALASAEYRSPASADRSHCSSRTRRLIRAISGPAAMSPPVRISATAEPTPEVARNRGSRAETGRRPSNSAMRRCTSRQSHRTRRTRRWHGQDEDRHAALDDLERRLGHVAIVLQRCDRAVGDREVRPPVSGAPAAASYIARMGSTRSGSRISSCTCLLVFGSSGRRT